MKTPELKAKKIGQYTFYCEYTSKKDRFQGVQFEAKPLRRIWDIPKGPIQVEITKKCTPESHAVELMRGDKIFPVHIKWNPEDAQEPFLFGDSFEWLMKFKPFAKLKKGQRVIVYIRPLY